MFFDELGLARWRPAVGLPEVLLNMSGRRDSAYEWGTAENVEQDFGVPPGTTLPAHPFHLMGVQQTMTSYPPIDRRCLPAAVGTVTSATSANTPFSLRSPSCPVPAGNGKEVSARPAFGSDMRSGGVTTACHEPKMDN